MKKKADTKNINSAAVAGLSAILLFLQQTYLQNLPKEVITIVPFIAGAIVFCIDWLLAKNGILSSTEIRAERTINKSINLFKKEIKDAKKLGIDSSELEKGYRKAVHAAAELYVNSK